MEETGFKDSMDGAVARDCNRNSTAGQTPEEDLAGTGKEAAHGTGGESAPPCKAPLVCCADGLDKDVFKICKEVLSPCKSSLRKLHLSQHHLLKKEVKYLKKSLAIIGNCIDLFLHNCRASEVLFWQKKLWLFVALFSELEADQLEEMYVCIKENQFDKFLHLWCGKPRLRKAPELALHEMRSSERDRETSRKSQAKEQVTTTTTAESTPSSRNERNPENFRGSRKTGAD